MRPTKRIDAVKVYICRCPECIVDVAFDPVRFRFVSGKECTKPQYLAHQKRVLAAAAASAPSSEAIPSLQLNHRLGKRRSSSSPEGEQHSERNPPTKRIRSVPDATDLSKLRDIQYELQKRQAQLSAVKPGDFIFQHHPSPFYLAPSFSNPNPHVFDLEPGRETNMPMLEYRQWLSRSLSLAKDIHTHERPAVQPVSAPLIEQLQEALLFLETMKEKEWRHRYRLQSQARELVARGHIMVVDTSKLSVTLPNRYPLTLSLV
ncbi:hypothetical protein PHLCEN_2v6587 [Hermanssonia centrifuga]|uniref:Uncharacterized protein n=1 Tax=Hermanssonia centrifuga TaxID=98765 RepID=A0A2R6NZ30_9APHY|nr:hypothetical protein PHLCEN_2v6587 [Hermanssonia centrifuga]